MGKGDRPEHSAPPELFYNDNEAVKYTSSSRVMEIQEKLTLRALELLALDDDDGVPKMILDVGCGSGLSGQVLTEEGVVYRQQAYSKVSILCETGASPFQFDEVLVAFYSSCSWLSGGKTIHCCVMQGTCGSVATSHQACWKSVLRRKWKEI